MHGIDKMPETVFVVAKKVFSAWSVSLAIILSRNTVLLARFSRY